MRVITLSALACLIETCGSHFTQTACDRHSHILKCSSFDCLLCQLHNSCLLYLLMSVECLILLAFLLRLDHFEMSRCKLSQT